MYSGTDCGLKKPVCVVGGVFGLAPCHVQSLESDEVKIEKMLVGLSA